MQTHTKIAFEAMADRPEIRAAIEEQIGKLEQRLGPVRACGVTVKGAGPQRSGRFELKGLSRRGRPDCNDIPTTPALGAICQLSRRVVSTLGEKRDGITELSDTR